MTILRERTGSTMTIGSSVETGRAVISVKQCLHRISRRMSYRGFGWQHAKTWHKPDASVRDMRSLTNGRISAVLRGLPALRRGQPWRARGSRKNARGLRNRAHRHRPHRRRKGFCRLAAAARGTAPAALPRDGHGAGSRYGREIAVRGITGTLVSTAKGRITRTAPAGGINRLFPHWPHEPRARPSQWKTVARRSQRYLAGAPSFGGRATDSDGS
jgi:hypothetical protein